VGVIFGALITRHYYIKGIKQNEIIRAEYLAQYNEMIKAISKTNSQLSVIGVDLIKFNSQPMTTKFPETQRKSSFWDSVFNAVMIFFIVVGAFLLGHAIYDYFKQRKR
jgi:hypothetical protein